MKRVAIYARVSTDRNQTTDNQLRELQAVAGRLGWTVVAIHIDEGISGAKGRDKRPGYDALLKDVARGRVQMVAAWSVDRLGGSLPDLVSFLGELQARNVDLYLHIQGLDTSTQSGRMLSHMLSVFSEFERAMIRERVISGLRRTTKRLGRPPMPVHHVEAIRAALASGKGIRAPARLTKASTTSVIRIASSMEAGARTASGI
jgi:DNA invertase Pin-like site-specific DNA recombinase